MTKEEGIAYARSVAVQWAGRSGVSVEESDFLSDAYWAYMSAVKNFKPDMGRTFKSYLYMVVKLYLGKKLRLHRKHQQRFITGSLEEDTAEDHHRIYTELYDFLETLDERSQLVCYGIMDGRTYEDIGKELKVCKQMISYILRIVGKTAKGRIVNRRGL